MNRTVPLDPAHPGERRGAQGDGEMAFAPIAVSGMTTMTLAFVDHRKFGGAKGRLQSGRYLVRYPHYFRLPPSICPQKP